MARHRRRWWSVGLYEPATIIASYMARRPPTFVHNLASARHINIAHGLYPTTELSDRHVRQLVTYLNQGVSLEQGRRLLGVG